MLTSQSQRSTEQQFIISYFDLSGIELDKGLAILKDFTTSEDRQDESPTQNPLS